MKCRKHTTDLTSLSGVCASCLRERLLLIIQAQEQANLNNTPNTQPPQIQRPVTNPRHHHTLSDQPRFQNSPHIATTNSGCIGATSSSSSKKNLIRFASFSNLFRSSHSKNSRNCPSVTSSPSVQRRRYVRNRGVSPVGLSDCEDGEGSDDESSEYESAESTSKQTPQKTPLRRFNGGGSGGWIFCLSPLVRARSPNRLWSMKGKGTDGGGGGVVPHLSYAKSFVANRSRKLADFGRSTDPNR